MKNIKLFELSKKIFRTIKLKIELSKYNNSSIAEYFRKQGAQIGDGCFFSIRSLGTEPYLVKIGNGVCITSGVVFNTHDGGTWIFREEMPDLRVFGPIIIEDNCLIGTNAQLFPNITIGRNSIVGSGSVVISDVPPNSIVMGVPARRFGSVEKFKEKCLEKWQDQKPPNFKADGVRHYDSLTNRDRILLQLREHLTYVFRDKLE